MQPFVCPECGRHSSFDPWTSRVQCPDCGYTPAADESAPQRPLEEKSQSLRCQSCGRELTGLRAPFDLVPRCPFCNSTDLHCALSSPLPKRIPLQGILLAVLVWAGVQLLLSWLDHSEAILPYPLVGAVAALIAWIWHVRRNR